MEGKRKLTDWFLTVIQILSVVMLVALFIPALNPMRYYTLIEDWSFGYFLGHSMEVDNVFTAAYPGIRELFANNAMATFCGFCIFGCIVGMIIGALLSFSKNAKVRSRGLMAVMIFALFTMVACVVVCANVYGANTTIEELGYDAMGMRYVYPLGCFVLFILALLEFVICMKYRKQLMIERGLYVKMSRAARIENRKGYAFISLYIIGFFCFTFLPLLFSLFSSFTYYNITAVQKWYGVTNFVNLFTRDSDFYKSLYNTMWYVVFSVPLNMVASLGLALLMNMDIKGKRIFRTLYYLPSVLSGIAVYLLWQWVFDPNAGLLNSALRAIGIDGPNWLYNPSTTKPAMLIMSLWGVGGGCIIILAALQSVPQELYEAGLIDGATGWSKFLHITLPLISPTLFFKLITGISGAFQIFDSAYFMAQNGGPDKSLLFYNLYLFNTAFSDQQMGKACAMAWILFIIIMLFTVIQLILQNKWVYYEGGDER